MMPARRVRRNDPLGWHAGPARLPRSCDLAARSSHDQAISSAPPLQRVPCPVDDRRAGWGLGGRAGPEVAARGRRLTVDGRCGAGAAAATHARCESATDQRPFRRRACKPRAARLQRNPTLALSASGMLASANDWRFDATPRRLRTHLKPARCRGATLASRHEEHRSAIPSTPPLATRPHPIILSIGALTPAASTTAADGQPRRVRARYRRRAQRVESDVTAVVLGQHAAAPSTIARRPDRLAFYMGCCPHRREDRVISRSAGRGAERVVPARAAGRVGREAGVSSHAPARRPKRERRPSRPHSWRREPWRACGRTRAECCFRRRAIV